MTNAVGLLAAALTTGAWLPQIHRCWRSRSCDDVTWLYLLCMVVGFVVWAAYGLLVHAPATVLCNVLSLGLALVLVRLKLGSASRVPAPEAPSLPADRVEQRRGEPTLTTSA